MGFQLVLKLMNLNYIMIVDAHCLCSS